MRDNLICGSQLSLSLCPFLSLSLSLSRLRARARSLSLSLCVCVSLSIYSTGSDHWLAVVLWGIAAARVNLVIVRPVKSKLAGLGIGTFSNC